MSILDYCPKTPRPLQQELLLSIERDWNSVDVFVGNLPTGCHAKGQAIMLANGTTKLVEDIQVGDLLMGPDSKPRRVIQLHHGFDQMYTIKPRRGPAWTVNSQHVLNLQRVERHSLHGRRSSTWVNCNISIVDYISKSNDYKNASFQWSASLEFAQADLPVDPYLFGTWLGDGSAHRPDITGMDEEILDTWQSEALRRGLAVRISTKANNRAVTLHLSARERGRPAHNSLLEDFRSLGVLGNKHIPLRYLCSSKQQRAELFAGLMDTDGAVGNETRSHFEITQSRLRLAKDILWLCRSLGMSAHLAEKIVNGTTYYRISGSLPEAAAVNIPVKLKRKRITPTKADLRHERFEVCPAGVGEYYGFTVDNDNLYLLDSFVVTHNCGKSMLAVTVAKWAARTHRMNSAILTPTNILRDQYMADNPGLHTLSTAGLYTCHNWDEETSCKVVKGKQKHYCKSCPYLQARKKSYVMPYGVYNNHIYLANRLHKDLAIFDEAHQVISLIQDRAKDRLWQHDYFYPNSLSTYSDLVGWLRMRETTVGLDTKQQKLLDELTSEKPRYVVEAGTDMYRGELRNCLKLLPVDVRDQPPILWPSRTKKILMLSATIGEEDVRLLGLDKRRVRFYKAVSPVSVSRRPIVYRPVGSMSVATRGRTYDKMVEVIQELAARHEGTKGMLHCTYEVAQELLSRMGDLPIGRRLMFHGKENRTEVVAAFKNKPASSGAILVGCGLEEGLDLPGDQGRWQAIVRIPWPSLEEPAIRFKATEDPAWYTWETVKKVLQASGRVVRSTADSGTTFILDSSFEKLYRDGVNMFPDWWKQALYQEVE